MSVDVCAPSDSERVAVGPPEPIPDWRGSDDRYRSVGWIASDRQESDQPKLVRRVGCDDFEVITVESTTPNSDQRHRRTIAFVGQEYWLSVDEFVASSPIDVALRLQLGPEAQGNARIIDQSVVVTPGLRIAILGARPTLAKGSVASPAGDRVDAPLVLARSRGDSVQIVTALFVGPCLGPPPRLVVLSEDVVAVCGTTMSGATDLVVWGSVPQERCLGPLSCEADVAWVRLADGALERGVVHGTTHAVAPGRTIHRSINDGWERLAGPSGLPRPSNKTRLMPTVRRSRR